MAEYYVYMMANKTNTVIYTGVTNNLEKRVYEHKYKKYPGSFTSKYNCTKLVYFEMGSDVNEAIIREKKIKAGSRKDKIDLIMSTNKRWSDLAREW